MNALRKGGGAGVRGPGSGTGYNRQHLLTVHSSDGPELGQTGTRRGQLVPGMRLRRPEAKPGWLSLLVLGVDGLVVCFKQEVDPHAPSLAKWDGNQ